MSRARSWPSCARSAQASPTIHGKGILHRDLKPENVLRTQAGTWAIADFGLARAVAESSLRLTATAEAMGSAFYTAPEQWKDAKRVDERADIYSAGKILQALMVGDTPVDDDVPAGKLRAVIQRAISQNRNRR
jgi:eukaryotic-like serine/threonine-protein kinase